MDLRLQEVNMVAFRFKFLTQVTAYLLGLRSALLFLYLLFSVLRPLATVFCSEDADAPLKGAAAAHQGIKEAPFPEDDEYTESDERALRTFNLVCEAIRDLENAAPNIPFPSYDFALDWPVLVSLAAPFVYALLSYFLTKWVLAVPSLDQWSHPLNTPDRSGLSPLFLVISTFIATALWGVAYGLSGVLFMLVYSCFLAFVWFVVNSVLDKKK